MGNDLFLRACLRQPTPRTPVWMMRQAGRYLPAYRELREKFDFLRLCKTPELASRVTLQPVETVGVDAAIIFSDILVLPEAMGMELVVDESGGGPRFPAPLRSAQDIARLIQPDPAVHLNFVMEALRITRRELNGSVPLIGFSGSPFTLAAYMVEGGRSASFRFIKEILYSCPSLAHALLGKLSTAVSAYLNAQIEAGAQAVQIFDTWGGVLTGDAFREFSLRYIGQAVGGIRARGAPIIVFCKDCGHSIDALAGTGCQVVGLDWTADIGRARKLVGDRVALQGNLDLAILYSAPGRIREEVKNILEKFGKGEGHIFNLGHGIHPDTPVEHAREFIRAVHEESVRYH
ncbi:MAG: uroporphyrinogen decarboxylase [Ignavibacteria bacterium]|nr:MAG: uroporphyrinogen decarboxylase [Ignavibacteria bacterium]